MAGERSTWCAVRLMLAFLWGPLMLTAALETGLRSAAWAGTDEPAPAAGPSGRAEGPPLQTGPPAAGDQQLPEVRNGPDQERPPSRSPDAQLRTAPSATSAPEAAPPPGTPQKEKDIVDLLHRSLSQRFLSTATWLDSFFGDERYEAESNRSQLKVRFDAFREDRTGMQYRDPILTLRLVLPQLRKMARLVITGDPNVEVDSTSPSPPGSSSSQLQPSTGSRLTTALQYFPLETAQSNLSIRAGVRLHKGRPGAVIGPRYRLLIPLDPWDLRFTQEVIWSSENRWQSRTRFDLERPLPRDLFFRTSLEGLWSEKVDGYPYSLSFHLRQPLDRNRALEYEWISSFQTSPTNILVEELLVFRYRQRFWKDWLFLEIDPQFRYPRDRSFVFTPGILFRIEMVFGDIQKIF